jgi:hypothetical protein
MSSSQVLPLIFYDGRVRQNDRVILILTRSRKPLGASTATDLHGKSFTEWPFRQDSAPGSLIAHGPADQTDIRRPPTSSAKTAPSITHRLMSKYRGHAAVLRTNSDCRDDLRRAVAHLRTRLDQRNLIHDRDHVGETRRCRVSTSPYAVDGAAARFDPHEVVAEVVELLLDSCLSCVPDRNDTK